MKLIRHSIYNVMGLGLPLLAAVFSIPELIHVLGDARFGLLTLIWAVVSYFGLFDLGLGRALTQKLAVELSGEDRSRIGPLVATSIVMMATLGVLAAVLMAVLAPWGVGLIQNVPNEQEAIIALYWMAAAMPSVVLTSGFRGILEARQAFAVINIIRLPMGLFTFLGPLVVVYCGRVQLDLIALVLAMGRVIACLVHGWYAWYSIPKSAGRFVFQRVIVKPICVSGGWMTVSNVVGPIMGYLDRFVVGALVSAQAVAYYATPQEVISKLSILPSSLMSVVFPRFSENNLRFGDRTIELVNNSTLLIIFLCFPLCAAISIFSPEILELWINRDFSDNASEILSLVACGMLVNSISFVPLNWLQATERSKRVALIHFIELPIFCAMLWFGIQCWGIKGAAYAWVLRIVLDACLLWFVLSIQEFRLKDLGKKYLFQSVSLSLSIYIVSMANFPVVVRLIVLAIIISYCIHRLIGIAKSTT